MEQTQLHLSFCGLTGKRKGISIFVPPTHTYIHAHSMWLCLVFQSPVMGLRLHLLVQPDYIRSLCSQSKLDSVGTMLAAIMSTANCLIYHSSYHRVFQFPSRGFVLMF